MLVVSWFICGFLYFFLYSYLFCKLVCEEKYVINFKMILFSFILGLLYYLVSISSFITLRPFVINFLIFIFLKIIYKKDFLRTIICVLFIFLVACVCEVIYGLFLTEILSLNPEKILKNHYVFIISNFIIFTMQLIIMKIPFINKFMLKIINWSNKNKNILLLIFIFFGFAILVFFTYSNFVLPKSILWLTNLFCISAIMFVAGYFNEKANNNRIITEYDQLLKYVNKYEKVVEDKSKRQHEYKNQLVLIKGMISKSNKKAIKYIDSLYEEEKDDSNLEMLKKLQYLPSGGLKGLIYYKLEEMKDKNINVFVDISPKVKNAKVNKQIDNNLKDISKIIGVYLDNAIEASVKSKEKYIILEIYLENDEWVFSLSNTYKGQINLNKIDNEGYTTKGVGKGYGLSLVKDIMEHNKNLRQERELMGIYYKQKLYMKK